MFAVDPVSIFLSIIVILFLINAFYDRNGQSNKNFPPGPRPLPIIGNFHILDRKRPFKTFQELTVKYGSIFSFRMGLTKVVVLCGYDTVKDALVNHAEEFADRPYVPLFQDAFKGHGVVFANGENWKVMRRFSLSTLRDFGMGKKVIESAINEECDSLVEVFQSYKGKPFENTMKINGAIANIIVSILLGHRFDYNDPKFLKLMSLISTNIRLLQSSMVLLYNIFPSLIRWLPGSHKTILKNIEELHIFIRETFAKHKEELDMNDQRNLIDAFLIKQKEEKPGPGRFFHDENLVNLVGNLFVAGMETISTTLRWGILLMMKYPEMQKIEEGRSLPGPSGWISSLDSPGGSAASQCSGHKGQRGWSGRTCSSRETKREKVQSEIDNVIGSSQPQIDHRKEMPYTDAVIHEIQRFGIIIPGNLPHATTRDVTFRGYFIPKGTQVIPLLSSVLQDKEYFEKPHEFYPQHFLDAKGKFVKNEAFIPFSAGRRSCAGENLAKVELFLFFTRLMQKFTFQPPPGVDVDLTPVFGATLSPSMHEICALPRN